MKITWFGHACFSIESDGKRIVTDPFDADVGYPVVPREADLVTISHEHWDHNAVQVFNNEPRVIRGNGEFSESNIKIQGFPSFHDKQEGIERGTNTIYKITTEGIDLLHLGDLGHVLGQGQVQQIGKVDVLLVPVGGTFTIDAEEACQMVELLKPRIIIPMHYGTPVLSFSLLPLEAFTIHYDKVTKKDNLEINCEGLPEKTELIVLDYLSC
ncbi:MAG: MBL fold metallo-hydrolase [Bacillota bacterium]|nr:MBL fold metallo-hydrolase [Bacillota bacterium]